MEITGRYSDDGVFTVQSGNTQYATYFFIGQQQVSELIDAGTVYGDANGNGQYDESDVGIGSILVTSYPIILNPEFIVTGTGTWRYDELTGIVFAFQDDGTAVGQAEFTGPADLWGRQISLKYDFANADAPPLVPAPSVYGVETADIIANFNPKLNSLKIDVSEFAGASSTFKACKKTSKLEKIFTKDISFIYDRQTGYLHYDANGSEAGSGVGGVFAILEGAPKLNASVVDFV